MCDVSSAVETACDSARLYASPGPTIVIWFECFTRLRVCDQAAARPSPSVTGGRAGRLQDRVLGAASAVGNRSVALRAVGIVEPWQARWPSSRFRGVIHPGWVWRGTRA